MMHAPIVRLAFIAGLALAAIAGVPGSMLAADALDAVRSVTERFKDVGTAEAAGYSILAGTPLEACIDEPGEGAMGFHYVNGDLVGDALVDPHTPEALLYVPQADGSLRFVGVEYVVFAEAWDAENTGPPSLFGHDFHLVSTPNRYELPAFYELHAWVWAENPRGTFNDWNPQVSCTALPDTATAPEPPSASSAPDVVAALVPALLGIAAWLLVVRARTRRAE